MNENLRVNIWRDKFTSDYLSEPSIVKFIENQSEHLSKLSLYHLKNVLQGDLDVLVNRAEFIIFMQSRVPLGPGKFHVEVLVWYRVRSMIDFKISLQNLARIKSHSKERTVIFSSF